MRFLNAPLVVLSGCALAAVLATASHAEMSPEVRYDLFQYDQGSFRFDRLTGKLEKMTITPAGVMYTEVPVLVSKRSPAGTHKPAIDVDDTPAVDLPATSNGSGDSLSTIGGRRPAPPWIEGPEGKRLPEDITDQDRRAALADITSYERELSIMQLLKSGDRITGAITVANKGRRSIQKLELTLYVPVVGKEHPEEYRFLFVDSGEPGAPLQPIGNTGESRTWLQPVDVASPAGNIKGNLDVKVTYIKFYKDKN